MAGGAGLGVKYLAKKDSHVVGMIGAGGMARTYLEAFKCVRDIKKVKVYSTNPANAKGYADEMSAKFGIDVQPVDSARDAVKGVDIVSCCTSSIDPVFKTEWLEPGMHVKERDAILSYFKTQKPYYYPFVFTLFWTGLRPSEAIALGGAMLIYAGRRFR